MAHRILELDKGFSYGGADKSPPWHIGETRNRWTTTDRRLTPSEAASIGWKRQDGILGPNGEPWWNPVMIPVYEVQDDAIARIPHSCHVIRNDVAMNDQRRYLSKGRGVTPDYALTDNTRIVDICNALCGAGAVVDSCLSIDNGRVAVMSLYILRGIEIEGDMIAPYFLVKDTRDGTELQKWCRGVVATVCANTLRFNEREAPKELTFQHRQGAQFNIDKHAEALIALTDGFLDETATIMQRFALLKLSDDAARKWIETAVGASDRAKNRRERVMDLYKGAQIGANMNDARRGDNLYSLWNAYTQWSETESIISRHKVQGSIETDVDDDTDKKPEDECRFQNLFSPLGAGRKNRERAFTTALAMVNDD